MDFDEKVIEEGIKEILIIARKRAEILGQLKCAVLANDEKRAMALARQICGIKIDHGSD